MKQAYEEKIQWLRKWAESRNEQYFDVANQRLCDDFEDKFMTGKRNLGRFLSNAFKKGDLKRARIGIQSGYWHNPRWVYSYELTNAE